MGELLNGLLRAVVVGLWFVVLLVAFYVSASGWSADFGRDMWRWQAQHTTSQKVKNNRITRLNVGWPKTTWYLVKHPSYNWKVLKKAFPFLTLRSQRIGKGNFAPRSMTRERFIYHILPAPLIALLLMFFIEFGIYPMLRHKLAKWLATQENNVFGSTADLPSW